ncbi:MAG: hypothetical protein AUH33_02515 [Chloroflexi bacterium 13_1_40CM_68_21]|nr:MAG: hypothetical protein AUH33_02515 [Chloroflexi bacterium 13_1_40CM_68_21]
MRLRVASLALTVALAACGSRAASAPEPMPTPAVPTVTPYQTMTPTPIPPTPPPTPTPTPGPALSTAAAEKYFHPLAGYELVLPPPEVDAQFQSLAAVPEITNIAAGVALRLVTRNGDAANMVVLSVALLPSYAALPGVLDEFGSGYSQLAAEHLTLASHPALYYETSPKSLVWSHRTFIVVVYGSDRAAMTRLAQALIASNP